jgi:hypothetical protein
MSRHNLTEAHFSTTRGWGSGKKSGDDTASYVLEGVYRAAFDIRKTSYCRSFFLSSNTEDVASISVDIDDFSAYSPELDQVSMIPIPQKTAHFCSPKMIPVSLAHFCKGRGSDPGLRIGPKEVCDPYELEIIPIWP